MKSSRVVRRCLQLVQIFRTKEERQNWVTFVCCETARCWLLYEQPSSDMTRCESVSVRFVTCSKSKKKRQGVKLFLFIP